jgi:AraC-like DNA-binding protein
MKQRQEIPTLSANHFRKVYVKPELFPFPPPTHEKTDGYFELMHRCIWSNNIAAHRLDFYMVFLVTAGEGQHTFGSETHIIRPNMLCFAGPEMINAWHSDHHDNSGFVCTFSADFFGLEVSNAPSLAELPFFQLNGPSILQLSEEKMAAYTQLFDIMTLEAKSNNPLSSEILRSYLHVLINKARSDLYLQEQSQRVVAHAGVRLLKEFKQMFMADINVIRTGHKIRLKLVSEYADQLGVSQNHLNDTVRTLTGESAGGLIQKQLMRQATMCLKHSLKNVSEIAYLMGFDDPSYFARFYKRHTGKSPSQVRASSGKVS